MKRQDSTFPEDKLSYYIKRKSYKFNSHEQLNLMSFLFVYAGCEL